MIRFESKVLATIMHNGMPGSDAVMLVALSGGADSVALLRVLLALGYKCEAAHCNFHLRGGESERDEMFVRSLCGRLGVRLHVAGFDTRAYAALHKVSIEMAARDLRYGFFNDLLANGVAEFVAVAHNSDDNAETVLLNLVRGTGLRGLCGMQYINGNVVRPLLDVSRSEITAYLAHLRQDYVTDSSNLRADVKRNKIRLNVLPMLEDLNPSVRSTLHRGTARLREAMTLYRWAADSVLRNVKRTPCGDEILAVADIPRGVSLEAVLFEWLFPKGFVEAQVNGAYNASRSASGNARFYASEYVLFYEKGMFCAARRDTFPRRGDTVLPREGKVELCNGQKLVVGQCGADIPRSELLCTSKAFIDAGNVAFPLTLRTLQPGDRFVPFGMKGSKLVSDYMADRKIQTQERLRQLVVSDKEKIVWLVGRRVDDRVKITPATSRVVSMEIVQDVHL